MLRDLCDPIVLEMLLFLALSFLLVLALSALGSSGLLLLSIATTHIHPGAGRALGIVDLPVARDSLGYPLIFASEVKGALKILCLRSLCRDANGRLLVDSEGRARCSESEGCKLCCCLFGPEPGEADAGSSILSILDLQPLQCL